jgi:hypothetical protein
MQNVTWSPGAELVRHEDVIVCVAANQYRDAESTVTIQQELYCHFLNKGLILVPFTLFMKDGVSIIVDVFLSVLFLSPCSLTTVCFLYFGLPFPKNTPRDIKYDSSLPGGCKKPDLYCHR